MDALLEQLAAAKPGAEEQQRWRIPKRIAYVVSHSLPFSSNGYAIRTHGIATALVGHGFEVYAFTRPGYPWNLPGFVDHSAANHHPIDGVHYIHQRRLVDAKADAATQASAGVEAYAELFRVFKPSVVIAASNFETALPALVAARQAGLPFVYEVRGFWEISRISRTPSWAGSPEFQRHVRFESEVAKAADRIVTLNRPMAEELVRRGAVREKIDIVPNAVPGLPELAARDVKLAKKLGLQGGLVVGYIGSLTAYEGLEDLVAACARLNKGGTAVKLMVVGSSSPLGHSDAADPFSDNLKGLAQGAGLAGRVVFTGRVSHDEIGKYYALADVIVIPRKPDPVSELVPPLKPVEALAYGRPLVVSDVAPLADLIAEAKLGASFRKGDRGELAAALRRVLKDAAGRQGFAKKARDWVAAHRTWRTVSLPLAQQLGAMAALPAAGPAHLPTGGGQAMPTIAAPASVPQQAPAPLPPPAAPPAAKPEPPAKPLSPATLERQQMEKRFAEILKAGGVAGLGEHLSKEFSAQSKAAFANAELTAAGVCLAGGFVDEALGLADAALGKSANLSAVRLAARVFYNAACLDRADSLAERLSSMTSSSGDIKFIEEIRQRKRLHDWALQPAQPRTVQAAGKRVLNLLAFSLPYTSVGYATRSHGLAVGIKHDGWDIYPYTRPGFPYDFKPELEGQKLPEQDDIDGITYRRMFDIERRGMGEVDYMLASIGQCENTIRQTQPAVVHAASNYVTALPALIAARRLGVPFIYEVRGFWEFTRSSRDEDFENTPKYRFMQLFEGLVARQADHVLTITTAMKEELIDRGVPAEKISIAYNSVDPSRFIPHPPNRALAERLGIAEGVPVIGYVGSFVDYEGLEDLVTAAAGLKQAGHAFRLLLVGDGAVFDALREQVQALGLEGEAILTGRVPHDEVEDYYSLIDIAPFPRKPWKVCELVSPLKPFEAMALEKVVVVSSTRALTEIVEHGRNGLVFEKGNVENLREVLESLIVQPALRERIGKAAREWIIRERSWDVAGAVCGAAYKKVAAPEATQ